MNCLIDENNISHSIVQIAKNLLLTKALVVNEARFRFTEIEFYYYCHSHEDGYAHKHDLEAGNWRLHNHGIDITLKGQTGYGGILIRGLKKDNDYFNGPRRVLFEIIKHFNSVNLLSNNFGVQASEQLNHQIFKTFREGLKTPITKCADPESYRQINYRFIVEPTKFDRKQFKNSEIIARGFKDNELAFAFLGYKLKS